MGKKIKGKKTKPMPKPVLLPKFSAIPICTKISIDMKIFALWEKRQIP